jgi:hypothetical protein
MKVNRIGTDQQRRYHIRGDTLSIGAPLFLCRVLNPERARRTDQASGPAPSIETLASPGSGGGIAAIAPKMESFIEANVTPGEYALFCMATAPDGRSHMEHGMIRQISAH